MYYPLPQHMLYNCVILNVGSAFAGAGGGGFISVLARGPSSKIKIKNIIKSNKVQFRLYSFIK